MRFEKVNRIKTSHFQVQFSQGINIDIQFLQIYKVLKYVTANNHFRHFKK